jgi:hypothetical protein
MALFAVCIVWLYFAAVYIGLECIKNQEHIHVPLLQNIRRVSAVMWCSRNKNVYSIMAAYATYCSADTVPCSESWQAFLLGSGQLHHSLYTCFPPNMWYATV